MNRDRLIPVKFCKDLENFAKLHFHVDWPSFFKQNLDDVKQVFTNEIGLATVDRTIVRHRDIYVEAMQFTYETLLCMTKHHAIHWIRQKALKIRNQSVISFFIMCSFIESICAFTVEHNRPELAEIPMIVLTDIIYNEMVLVTVPWLWIDEVATMLNRKQLLRIDEAIEFASYSEHLDPAKGDESFTDMENEAP